MQMRYLKYQKRTNGKEEKVADLHTVLQQEMDTNYYFYICCIVEKNSSSRIFKIIIWKQWMIDMISGKSYTWTNQITESKAKREKKWLKELKESWDVEKRRTAKQI